MDQKAAPSGRSRWSTPVNLIRTTYAIRNGPTSSRNTANDRTSLVATLACKAEVIDQSTMQTRGYRSVSEAAQGAAGVTAGDFPAEPAAFSMRGYTNSQINTLYNGIRIGPQNMTSRVMDTGNLQSIEFVK